MPEQKPRRRAPAPERKIAELQPEQDIRARLMGTIIGVTDSSILLDDGSGKVEVIFDQSEALLGMEEGKFVRVVVRILPLIDGYECRGECIQQLDGFDVKLYKSAREISIG
jgi:hypothetical protein